MARVKLGDVAREYKATSADSSLPIVGLEHLTPGEIALESWDEGTETTFTKAFRKGQMLFGRRRAYLKKAALAPFDGICSGDIIVIEAIPEKIDPALLPFIIQNDLLFDYAVGKSAGSLSPRVKWSDLKNYEFDLPDLPQQAQLVELLRSAYETKKAYQKLLTATDNLVKSQFIEMFGDPIENAHTRLSDIGSISSGGTPSRKVPEFFSGDLDWYSAGELNSLYLSGSVEKITREAVENSSTTVYPAGTLLIGMYDTAAMKMGILKKDSAANQACAGFIPSNKVNILWLYVALSVSKDRILLMRRGCRQKNLNVGMLKSLQLNLPSIDAQNKFTVFFTQSEKSKFATQPCTLQHLMDAVIGQEA